MTDVDFDLSRPCSFCGSRWFTSAGLSAAICHRCLEALGGAAEAERVLARPTLPAVRNEPLLEAVADALNDWLATSSPGWSDLDMPIDDHEAELARHRAGYVWLALHGYDTRDWQNALANIARRRREALEQADREVKQ